MIALMFGLGSNGAKSHLSSLMKFQLFYSTAPAAASSRANTVLLEFLVNSLGFSQKQALSTTSKVTRSRLRNYEPHLLLDFFNQMGLNKSQIKTLVSSSPALFFHHVDNNLKPKIKVLQQLGLSTSELVSFISKSDFFRRGLDNSIKPSIDYLQELLGDQDSVARVVKKDPRLLSCNLPTVMPPNILVLQNLGFSQADIVKLFRWSPRILIINPEWIKGVVQRVEKILHIPRESGMFLHGIRVAASLSDLNINAKVDVLRNFGWCESDIFTMVRRHPYCLTTSEAKMRSTLKFFMNELGYGSNFLASFPTLLSLSLEKRVIPRNEILKILKENQLLKGKRSFYTAMICTESKFLEKYVLPFSEKRPELYDLYIKNTS